MLGMSKDTKVSKVIASIRPLAPLMAILFGLFVLNRTLPPPAVEEVRASGCSQQQIHTVENAFLTTQDIVCIIDHSGLLGTSTAVQGIEAACNFLPTVEPALIAFINAMISNPAALQKLSQDVAAIHASAADRK